MWFYNNLYAFISFSGIFGILPKNKLFNHIVNPIFARFLNDS